MGKVAVIGLGPSRNLFIPHLYKVSIGVNDIWKYCQTDAIVCLDKPRVFYPLRIKTIERSKPAVFFSQIVAWDVRPDFEKIDILPGYPDRICRIDLPAYQKSYCSPFVAAQIAYKYYRADEVHLFGVDMLDHPHLKGELLRKIKIHFGHLNTALKEKGCKLIIHGEGVLKNIS